ncbi:DnaD domain-containing protein [Aerococcus suis]|nr:DnaD domain protein [Aerococcus suis]
MYEEQYTVIRTEILEKYHQLDITNESMMFLIHLLGFIQSGNSFPSINALQRRMGYTDEEIYACIDHLLDRGVLAIKSRKNEDGQVEEYYSLHPLYMKLEQLEEQKSREATQANQDQAVRDVFNLIEDEFGRQLSPTEYEMVTHWLTKDRYQPSMIKDAVREAALSNAYNFRYIGRILLNWQQQGKQTSFHHNVNQEKDNQQLPPVSLGHWLDVDN